MKTKEPTPAQMLKLGRSKSLFQVSYVNERTGRRRQGPVARALEAVGMATETARMSDCTGERAELSPVVAVAAPADKARAALREIAAFV